MVPKKKQMRKIEHIHPLALHKHVARCFHKHAHKIVHVGRHVHHFLMHSGELVVLVGIGLCGIMFANFTGSLENLERANMTEVGTYLLKAINNPQDILKNGNLISIWKMDDSVENTFTKGYCTYGAARISPEFFPYATDGLTQQRTRGGNAIDRCENAAATGYKIGTTPVQGALVVYGAGGRFGQYGHVGKVMHYDRGINKIIVRDMAWVSKFTMSDHRDDLNTANVKCYIYNSKTDTPTANTPTTNTTTTGGTATVQTPTSTSVTTGHAASTATPIETKPVETKPQVTTPVVNVPVVTTPVENKPQVTTPVATVPVITTPVITTPVISGPVTKNIELDLNNLSDLGAHLAGLRNIEAEILGKEIMSVGNESILTLKIIDKKTGEKISAISQLNFEFIISQDTVSTDYASMQLIDNGELHIHITAQHAGNATLIINFGGEKIGKISLKVE